MVRYSRALCAVAILWLLPSAHAVPVALARDGQLDPSFGAGGRIVVNYGSERYSATDVLVDHEGRVLVSGQTLTPGGFHPFVIRLGRDGFPDSHFGDGGIVWLPFWVIHGAVVDRDGRIVLAGNVPPFIYGPDYDYAVGRLLDDGQLDPSFGEAGILRIDGGPDYETLRALAIDSQARIVLVGEGETLRVSGAGELDKSYGDEGFAPLPIGDSSQLSSVAIDPRGQVAVAGSALIAGSWRLVIARLGSAGELDTSFGLGGWAVLEFPGPADKTGSDLDFDPLGRAVVVGYEGPFARSVGLVARLLPGGAPDPSFDGDGRVLLRTARIGSVSLDTGRILIAGKAATTAMLTRLDSSGALDRNFGSEGKVIEEFSGGEGLAVGNVDSGGRYLLAAGVSGRFGFGIGVARYLNPGDGSGLAPSYRCRGKPATIVGSGKDDRLRGTGKRDVIVGRGGDDAIRALDRRDIACGGAGSDRLYGGSGNDRLYGDRGDDRLFGGPGKDRLFGGRGRDRLRGGPGDDRLRSGHGS